MKTILTFRRLNAWLRIKMPIAMLIALFQRTPVVRVAAFVDEAITASPIGSVMKSLLTAAASLGAVHSLAGATALSTTAGTALTANLGKAINPVAFNVTNTINIASWKIGGSLPPGLFLNAAEANARLTGPGTLDVTTVGTQDGYGGGTAGITSTTPILQGTPTQAGNYTFTLQAFEFAKLSGQASGVFSYSITVTDPNGGSTSGGSGTSGGGGSVGTSTGSAPAFTTQPSSQSVKAGSTLTLSVAANGTPAPTYQWQFNNVTIPSVTGTTLVLANVQSSDAGTYKAVATNSAGSVSSQTATLTVSASSGAPVFTIQPASQTVAAGTQSSAVFTASTSTAATYQWFKNGSAIGGQTSATLTLSAVTSADSANYTIVASNSSGSTTSLPATLLVAVPNGGSLANFSLQALAGTGNQTLITGFTISGNVPKKVLVQVLGPTLNTLSGTSGVLSDPVLKVYGSTGLISTNDNWGDSPNDAKSLADTFTSVGALALNAGSKDAALVLTLVPGVYTVQVTSANGTDSGIVYLAVFQLP